MTCLGESQSQVSSSGALSLSCSHTPAAEHGPQAHTDLCASEMDTESLEGTGLAQVKQPEQPTPPHPTSALPRGTPSAHSKPIKFSTLFTSRTPFCWQPPPPPPLGLGKEDPKVWGQASRTPPHPTDGGLPPSGQGGDRRGRTHSGRGKGGPPPGSQPQAVGG